MPAAASNLLWSAVLPADTRAPLDDPEHLDPLPDFDAESSFASLSNDRVTSSTRMRSSEFETTTYTPPAPRRAAATSTMDEDHPPRYAQADTRSGRERRVHPRRDSDCQVSVCRKPASVTLTSQNAAWHLHASQLKGRLVDVSMSGMALQLPEAIEPETEILLRVSNRNFAQNVDAAGKVLRCSRSESGRWNVVCRLTRNLTFEQVTCLGKYLFSSTIV
jgi:hypothetical protein